MYPSQPSGSAIKTSSARAARTQTGSERSNLTRPRLFPLARRVSAEDVATRTPDVREGRRRDLLTAATPVLLPVAFARGAAIHLDRIGVAIDDPDLGHAGSGVERKLAAAVVRERGVRDLDEEKRVRRVRVSGAVEVRPRSQEHDVGLWFRAGVETDRILHMHDDTIAQGGDEAMGQPIHNASVPGTDRSHFEDLAVDQLHPTLGGENPHLGHLVLLIHGQPVTP